MKLSTWNWISVPRVARRIDSCEKVIKPGRRAQRGPEQRNAIFCHCSPSRQRNRLFFSSSLFSSFFSFFFLFLPTLCNRWRTTRERARFNIFNGKRRYNKSGFRAVCCPARGLFNEKQRVTKNLQGNGADIFLGQMPIDYRFYSPLNGRNAQLFRGFPRFRSFNFFSTHDFSSFFDSLPVKKGIFVISRVCIFTTYATTGKLFPNISSYPYCVPSRIRYYCFSPLFNATVFSHSRNVLSLNVACASNESLANAFLPLFPLSPFFFSFFFSFFPPFFFELRIFPPRKPVKYAF